MVIIARRPPTESDRKISVARVSAAATSSAKVTTEPPKRVPICLKRNHECPDSHPSAHCWLPPPVQVQSWTLVPLAVPAPETSRHSPDWTPVMVPLAFTVHCWL